MIEKLMTAAIGRDLSVSEPKGHEESFEGEWVMEEDSKVEWSPGPKIEGVSKTNTLLGGVIVSIVNG